MSTSGLQLAQFPCATALGRVRAGARVRHSPGQAGQATPGAGARQTLQSRPGWGAAWKGGCAWAQACAGACWGAPAGPCQRWAYCPARRSQGAAQRPAWRKGCRDAWPLAAACMAGSDAIWGGLRGALSEPGFAAQAQQIQLDTQARRPSLQHCQPQRQACSAEGGMLGSGASLREAPVSLMRAQSWSLRPPAHPPDRWTPPRRPACQAWLRAASRPQRPAARLQGSLPHAHHGWSPLCDVCMVRSRCSRGQPVGGQPGQMVRLVTLPTSCMLLALALQHTQLFGLGCRDVQQQTTHLE